LASQLLTCVYRPEFGDGYAIDAETRHPLNPNGRMTWRFFFKTLDELMWLTIEAANRGLCYEDSCGIRDNAERALANGLCDVSYDDERGIA
jgi:hypothetical protein